jgi:hypothetical protein
MEKWAEIRRPAVVAGRSKRSVSGTFGIYWDSAVKILEQGELPGYRQGRPHQKRKIGP